MITLVTEFFFYSFLVIPFIEVIKRKSYLWLCIPNHKCIYYVVIITNNWHIIRNRKN